MENFKTDKNALRNFGLIMGLFFAIVAMVILIKHRQSTVLPALISSAFFLIAISMPALLKYLYIAWMKFAFILSWFNTRLFLCVIFYLVFSPAGLIMRIFKVDFLERKFAPGEISYWKTKDKEESASEDYSRQF